MKKKAKKLRRITKTTIDASLHKREQLLIKSLNEISVARAEISDGQYHYEVNIYSYWAREGEKSVKEFKGTKNLINSVSASETEFMKINSRSDVQGELRIFVVSHSGYKYLVFQDGSLEFHKNFEKGR